MTIISNPPVTKSIFQYPPNFPSGVVSDQWIAWFREVQTNVPVFPAPQLGYALGWDGSGNLVNVANTGADQTAEWTAADAIVAGDAAADTAAVASDLTQFENDLADTSSVSLGDALVGVKQPYPGAIARTQHSKNTEWLSVLDFGADATGATSSSAAFNAAISALPNGYGTVHVPAGIYLITAPITLTTNQGLVGDGTGASFLKAGADSIVIVDTNQGASTNNNLTIKDLYIYNGGAYTGVTGIRLSKASFFDVSNIYCTGIDLFLRGDQASGFGHCDKLVMYNGQNGVYLHTCSNFVITNSTLSSSYTANTYKGVVIDSHCDGVELSSVNIEGSQYGVHIANVDGGYDYPLSTVMTNVQSGANGPTTVGRGFWIEAGSGVTLNNCIALQSSGNGIQIGTNNGVYINNTVCAGNSLYGLYTSGSNVFITGGGFVNNGLAASNTYSGLVLGNNLSNVSAVGCVAGGFGDFGNTQKYGIEVGTGCTNIAFDSVTYGLNQTGPFLFGSIPNRYLQQTTLFIQTAQQNVSNTVAETSIIGTGVGSLSLPANFWTVGKTITLKAKGSIANTATPTLQWRLLYGATALIDTTALTMTAITGAQPISIEFEATCTATGVSGSVTVGCRINYGTTNMAEASYQTYPGTATVDTTAAGLLDLKVTWGTADSSNSVTTNLMTVEAKA